MGSTLSAVKTLIVPAVLSLIIFLLLTYVVVPVWRRYRARYSQYLPIETISDRTSSLRHRLHGWIAAWPIRIAQWRFRRGAAGDRIVSGVDDVDFDSDGEELGEVVPGTATVDRARDRLGAGAVDDTRRLSRDLEEGFMDDSDEEGDSGGRR